MLGRWVFVLFLVGCDAAQPKAGTSQSTSATTEGGGSDGTGSGGYHPEGWSSPDVHGMAAKFQEQDCLGCHGSDLSGGTAGVACVSCHGEGWETDCTFCHGGVDNNTGAPPESIADETDASVTSFPPHSKHVQETELKRALDCTECHRKPTDVFSAGHLFVDDATPGVADTHFGDGLSSAATWDGGGCSNVYCHGNGLGNNGTVDATDSVACGDCHPTSTSGANRMSGRHEDHLGERIGCEECHSDVVNASRTIIDGNLHVNGTPDVHLPSGMAMSGDTCTGTCHGENHRDRRW